YPRLMPAHAKDACAADIVVSSPLDLDGEAWTLDLYGSQKPPFIAVRLDGTAAIEAVRSAAQHRVYDVAFFEDDICRHGGELLADFVNQTAHLHRHLRYHAI